MYLHNVLYTYVLCVYTGPLFNDTTTSVRHICWGGDVFASQKWANRSVVSVFVTSEHSESPGVKLNIILGESQELYCQCADTTRLNKD